MISSDSSTHELLQVLHGLSSESNQVRTLSETVFESKYMSRPVFLLPALTMIMGAANTGVQSEPTLRSLAAVLFRRVVNRVVSDTGKTPVVRCWEQLDEMLQMSCRASLLAAFSNEIIPSVQHKIGDAIAEAARLTLVHGSWPELTSALLGLGTETPANTVEGALRILAAVPELALTHDLNVIASNLIGLLAHPNGKARLAVIQALNSIFFQLDGPKQKVFAKFIDALPNVLAALSEDEQVEAIDSVIEIAAETPKLFKNSFASLAQLLLTISNDSDAEDHRRISAIELLVTLAEASPPLFKKQPEIMSAIVSVLLSQVAAIDDDDDWYTTLPDDDYDDDSLSSAAEQALDRLSCSLGGRYLAPPLFAQIPPMLASTNWAQRYSALRTIASIAEGCVDVLEDQLGPLLALVWPRFGDSHPRVQYAACHALGQLCTDFAGILQQQYHREALQALVGVLVQSGQARVQAHAAAALINFAEGCDLGAISPFLDDIIARLISLLKNGATHNGPMFLQEQLMATLAAFAEVAKHLFIPYYPTVVPLLLEYLTASLEKQYRPVQCRALEAISVIAEAVGRETFAGQMEKVVTIAATLQRAQLPDDDPMREYLAPAWVKLSGVIGAEFAPLLELVIPPLLAQANQQPDVALFEAQEDIDEEQYGTDEWEFISVRGKQVGIKTSVLEEKCDALENLAAYATKMGPVFSPYVSEVMKTARELSKFTLNTDVQLSAIDCLSPLVEVVVKSGNLQQADLYAREVIGDLLTLAVKPYEAEIACCAFDAIVGIMKTIKNFDDQAYLSRAMAAIDEICRQLVKAYQDMTETEDEDEDEQEAEDIMNFEAEEELMYSVSRLFAALITAFKGYVVPHAANLMAFCAHSINSTVNVSLRHASMCIIDDMVKHGGPASAQFIESIQSCLLKGLADKDNDVRQSAVFGIGLCAEFGKDAYQQFCLGMTLVFRCFLMVFTEQLSTIMGLITMNNAKAQSHLSVTDNAVSAISRILSAYPALVDGSLHEILPVWLGGFPVITDTDESITAYNHLLSLLGSPRTSEILLQSPSALLAALVAPLASQRIKLEELPGSTGDILKTKLVAAAKQLIERLPSEMVRTTLAEYNQQQLASILQ